MRPLTTFFLGFSALVSLGLPLAAQSLDDPPTTNSGPASPPIPAEAPAPTATLPAPAATPAPAPQTAQQVPPGAMPAVTTTPAKTAGKAAARPKAPASAVAAATPAPAQTPAKAVPEAEKPAADAKEDAAAAAALENDDGIAAVVNDESISDYEVRQRMALFIATSGLRPTDDDRKRIRAQILDQLQNEKLELQEAVKKHITVSPTEVDKQIGRIMDENRFNKDQMRTALAAAGSSETALRTQITAQIAWQKTVQSEFQSDINISPAQIDAALSRYADGANKPHYLVAEIFLPVDSPDQDAKVKKNAEDVYKQISSGAPFPAIAHQFSQNPSAAAGGDIGWVHDGQLAPELNATLTKMTPGGTSEPVRSIGGYYILNLRERQEPLGTKVETAAADTGPKDMLPLARLLLPLNVSDKAEVEAGLKAAMGMRQAIASCDQLSKLHEQIPHSVYMDLGTMKLSELSPDIQKALAQTKAGDVAPPFASDAGVEIIARCDKRAPVLTAFTIPSRDQISQELFEEQISAMARRYIRDLKREANVEVRDASGQVRDHALSIR